MNKSNKNIYSIIFQLLLALCIKFGVTVNLSIRFGVTIGKIGYQRFFFIIEQYFILNYSRLKKSY